MYHPKKEGSMTPINGTFGYDFCLICNVMLEKVSTLDEVLKAVRDSLPPSPSPPPPVVE